VSHVALISKLTSSSDNRVTLYSYRQAANVVSSIVVYMVTFFMLKSNGNSNEQVSQDDNSSFGLISMAIVGVGLIFTVMFQMLVKEPSDQGWLIDLSPDSSNSKL